MTATLTPAAYHRRMTERSMRDAIIEIVTCRGGKVFFVHDSRSAPATADLPDLIVIAPWMRAVFLVELKSQRRPVTTGQAEVLALLAGCRTVISGIVRPVPREGEMSYDQFLGWLDGSA